MSWHRQLDAALLILLVLPAPAVGAGAFSGTWHYAQCGAVNRESDCRGLTLILIQDGSRLCGVHGIHATPPARHVQLDEGPGPSVSGTLTGDRAVIVLLHGRTGALAKAEISLVGGKLLWRLVEGPEGDPYLPDTATMTPARYIRFAAEARRKCAKSPDPAHLDLSSVRDGRAVRVHHASSVRSGSLQAQRETLETNQTRIEEEEWTRQR